MSTVSAGGGLYHSGNLKNLDRTTFEGNTAQEGPAAFVQLGDVDSMSGTAFDANILSCADGTYAIDLEQDSDEVNWAIVGDRVGRNRMIGKTSCSCYEAHSTAHETRI